METTTMANKTVEQLREDRGGVLSVETGMRLVARIGELSGPQMLKVIAKEADMPPAKAHRYLVSFCKVGLVEQDPATGLYGLGPLALHLGLAALRGRDVVQIGAEALVTLCAKLDETVALAVWGAYGPVIVRMEEASRPVTVHVKVGSVMPLSSSATGRAMAAYMPASVIDPLLALEVKLNRKYPERAALISRSGIQHVFEEVRRKGIAQVADELLPGVSALAAPVFDLSNRPVAAIVTLGASGAFDSSLKGPIARELMYTCNQVTGAVGGSSATTKDVPEYKPFRRRPSREDRQQVQTGISVKR